MILGRIFTGGYRKARVLPAQPRLHLVKDLHLPFQINVNSDQHALLLPGRFSQRGQVWYRVIKMGRTHIDPQMPRYGAEPSCDSTS
jgi:hypothetical protein